MQWMVSVTKLPIRIIINIPSGQHRMVPILILNENEL
jgi:hypothetical protein